MNNLHIEKFKNKAKANKSLLANFTYMSILQVFILLTPLITFPYLTRVLGTELYGLVITSQILSSYALIVVRFGFDQVSARHISLWRDNIAKLSEVMSSILSVRFVLWLFCFVFYIAIVLIIPVYREHFYLFAFSYGLTINVLLFPQFFFQGIEQMKFITYINIGIQSIFIILTFIVIKSPDDYLLIPVLRAIGYLLGGIAALLIIFNKYKIKYTTPTWTQIRYYIKDALPLFATDAICTIKDKLSYLLLGICISMSDVVIYDVGSKLTSLAVQPLTIINTVLFPKMAKEKNDRQFIKFGLVVLVSIMTMVVLINLFLKPIAFFLIGKEVPLLPIRLFLLSPLFLGIGSYISSCFIIARGYNRYVFYSILVTTSAYLILLVVLLVIGRLNTVMSFITLTVVAYLIEMLYRMFVARKILRNSNKQL